MRRTILIISLVLCCLNGQTQYYYCFDQQKQIFPTDTVLLVNDNPFVNNYISNNSTLVISRNKRYAIVANREKARKENLMVYPVFKTEEGELLGCNGQILFWPNHENNLEIIVQSFPLEILQISTSYVLAKVSEGYEYDDLSIANKLQESGLVLFSHPNFVVNFQQCTDTISDTYFSYQFYLHSIGQTINDGHVTTIDADINAPEAWNITNGTSSIIIAIIDGGVTNNHPDLPSSRQIRLSGSNFAATYDGSSENDPSPVGNDNHGNACSGIIGATHNNEGIAGIAQDCLIMPIRVPFENNATDAFVAAIDFASNNGADIISNSWGVNTSNPNAFPAIVNAINNATLNGRNGKGCIITFSAGNTAHRANNDSGYVLFPANCPNEIMITIGASDRNNYVANYSPNGDKISVVAPSHKAYPSQISGEKFEVWSIDIPGSQGYNPDSNNNETLPSSGINYLAYTGRFGGTSAACPQVAGVAALMLSTNNNLTASEVKSIIESTTKKIGTTSYQISNTHPNGTWNQEMGYGLVDAHKAVVFAMEYGYDMSISGDNTLSDCDRKTYTCDILHPELFTYSWTTTPNMSIAYDNGSSVTIIPTSTGMGILTVNVYQQSRLMYTMTKSINITSVLSNPLPISTTSFHISSNTTWSVKTFMPVEVTIDSLATLTITDTLLCRSSSRLIVRPGGKLIVDGGTLTSACANEMWQGIEVVGDRTQHQTAANQGTVILRNNATIENAHCAIKTGLAGNEWLTAGGIVQCTGATFRNNRRAVEFLSYADTLASGNIGDNKSWFKDCTFTLDNNNLFLSQSMQFLNHVTLWDVKGVSFEGCTFENSTTGNTTDRKHGIYALGAGFMVNTLCNTLDGCNCHGAADTSLFAGFSTAVEVGNDGCPYSVTIDEAKFENNGTGVSIQACDYATVTRCTFDLSTNPVNTRNTLGLRLDNSAGFHVEGNTFHVAANAPSSDRWGVYVLGSVKQNNSLYRNGFENLTRGVFVTDTNGLGRIGLCFSCNTFKDCDYGIFVSPNGSIATMQGNLSKGADNSFTGTQTRSLNNLGQTQINYYHSSNSSFILHNPTGVLTESNLATLNPCNPTICGNVGPVWPVTGFGELVSSLLTPAGNSTAAAQNAPSLEEVSQAYYAAVRRIMADSVESLPDLLAWHTAAGALASPYALTEIFAAMDNSTGVSHTPQSQADAFSVGASHTPPISQLELDNYAAFRALAASLRPNVNNSAVNWPAATPAQIAELQRIAEANTGRSSTMAKGVLCFFFDICYDNVWDDDGMGETRRGTSVPEETSGLMVYPNPAQNNITISSENLIYNIIAFNQWGQQTFSNSPNGQYERTINTTDWPAGLYLLRVETETGIHNIKVIITKNS